MIASETVARANAFVLFDLLPTPLRLWDGVGTTSWDGQDWIGAGDLGSVDGLNGTRGLVAERVTYRIGGLTLGLTDQRLAAALARRRRVTLWAVVFNALGVEVARSVVHRGRIDTVQMTRTDGTLGFDVHVETAFVGANRIPWNIYTDTDQQQLWPGDRAFEFVSNLNGKRIVWP